MNSINLKNIGYMIATIVAVTLFTFAILPNTNTTAEAYGGGGGDGGCCGGGGGGDYSGGGGGDYTPPYTPPVTYPAAKCVSFTISGTSVPHGGGNVTLTWSTQNATSVSINNGVGAVGASGSKTVFVNSNTTFTLTATGTGGNASCAVAVKVSPPPAAKCVSFTASKTTVPHGGGNVTLTWNAQNVNSVSINNGVGNFNSSTGSTNVFVNSNTTYILTANGTNSNDTCQVTITVNTPEPVAKCVSFTASRNSVPHGGGNVTLTWSTNNVNSVSINNGVGNFNSSTGSTNVFVNSNTTYTLTANGTNSDDTCQVTISVDTPDPVAKCVSFTANKTTVDEDGENVRLTWNTQNVNSVHINNGVGNFNSSTGSTNVFVDNDTTFTLTAYGTNGNDTCKVTIRAEEEEDEEPKPRCELEISKTRVNRGDKVTLSWETRNAEDIRIRDDRGNTIFDTDDYRSSERKRYLDGEVDLIINQSTEFTMTARGDGGSRTCRVDVEVDELEVYEKRDQGLVISLTQVPYTGFEAGPFLTFLFYAMLTLWALFIAYILVIKKGAVLGFSLYGKNAAMSETDTENRKKVEALVAKYSQRNGN